MKTNKSRPEPVFRSSESVSESSNSTSEPCDAKWLKEKVWPVLSIDGREIRIVDLFCGCGGLSLGAVEAARIHGLRAKIVWALDLDPAALMLYHNNFSSLCERVTEGGIQDFIRGKVGMPLSSAETKLVQELGQVDLLVAGPPCQGHSDLNNSSRRSDPRNSLYFRVVRAAEILNPKVVIIENVPTVIHDKGNVVERSKNALEGLGYWVTSITINTASIGLAQTRKRHILIGAFGDPVDLRSVIAKKVKRTATLTDYIADLKHVVSNGHPYDSSSQMRKDNQRRAAYLIEHDLLDLPNEQRPKCHQDGNHSYVSMYGRLSWSAPAQTITSGFGSMGQGRFLHPDFARTLTPHEAARIQGFPDFFSFKSINQRTKLQEVIGNAVPPKLSAFLISEMIKSGHL